MKPNIYRVIDMNTGDEYYFNFRPLKKDLMSIQTPIGSKDVSDFAISKIHINTKNDKTIIES